MTEEPNRHLVARGNNLVLFAPPSPISAEEVLSGVFDRLAGLTEERPGFILALAPLEAVGEWARIAEAIRPDLPIRVAGAGSADRVARLLPSSTPLLLFTTPEAALALVQRGGLKPGDTSGLLVLWPEAWGPRGESLLTELFQDVPKETQRIIVSSAPRTVSPLVERHAWRAVITDQLGQPGGSGAGSAVMCAPVSWSRRLAAIKDAVDQFDPETVTVWAGGEIDLPEIEKTLRETGVPGSVTSQTPKKGALTVAFDLPSPESLGQMSLAGPVLLLVPPGAEGYAAWLAPTAKPVHLRGALHRVREESDRLRAEILEALEKGGDRDVAALAILAPLLERYDAAAVAAALFRLWRESGPGERAARSERPAVPGVRLWISAGKRDSVTTSDLVAVLAREGEVPREAIGRIEIRESFSLVEIDPSAGPEQVAERVTGKTIRKRRLVARLDRSSAPLVERVAKRLPRPKDRGRA